MVGRKRLNRYRGALRVARLAPSRTKKFDNHDQQRLQRGGTLRERTLVLHIFLSRNIPLLSASLPMSRDRRNGFCFHELRGFPLSGVLLFSQGSVLTRRRANKTLEAFRGLRLDGWGEIDDLGGRPKGRLGRPSFPLSAEVEPGAGSAHASMETGSTSK